MTHRERLEKALDNMEKTSVCLDVFDRAIEAAKREVWELVEKETTNSADDAYVTGNTEATGAYKTVANWARQQKEHP